MPQQTQNVIFHTKMLQNALWCQINGAKKKLQLKQKTHYLRFKHFIIAISMLCNILEYCSQALDIHGHRILQLILFLFMTL
jgi:hypothetical protein